MNFLILFFFRKIKSFPLSTFASTIMPSFKANFSAIFGGISIASLSLNFVLSMFIHLRDFNSLHDYKTLHLDLSKQS